MEWLYLVFFSVFALMPQNTVCSESYWFSHSLLIRATLNIGRLYGALHALYIGALTTSIMYFHFTVLLWVLMRY